MSRIDDYKDLCGSCKKEFRFVDLERRSIKGKSMMACESCIKAEKDRKKIAREKKVQPSIKKETITTVPPSEEFLIGLIGRVTNEVVEKIHDELKDSVVVPRHPCIEGVFLKLIDKQEIKPYEFDKWRHLYIDKTRKILLNLWFEDMLRKTKNGWYVINPEKVTYNKFVSLLGYWNKYAPVADEEFRSIIENTIGRSKNNPPEAFNTPGTERKNRMRQELFLENYDEEITGRIRELTG